MTYQSYCTMVGCNVSRLRREQGMDTGLLALLCGFLPSTITRMEAGELPVTPQGIAAVAVALGVPVRAIQPDVEISW